MDSVGLNILLGWLIPLLIINKIGLLLLFRKSGIKFSWQALIPFWNWFVLAKVVGRGWWYGILIQIPMVGVIIWYTLSLDLIKSFGRFRFLDNVLALLLQPFYFIYLGIQKDVVYLGPSNSEEFNKKYTLLKKNGRREWADAILFAVVVAYIIRTFFIEAYKIPTPSMEKTLRVGDFLFVSKVHYGARFPMTPIAIPFAHQDIAGIKAYSEILKLPYMRFPALEKIKRGTIVVFNYPNEPDRPVDKKTHYIKRCVGLPGDSLQVRNGFVYTNGKLTDDTTKLQFQYLVSFNKYELTDNILYDELDLYDYIRHADIASYLRSGSGFSSDPLVYEMPLDFAKLEKIKKFVDLKSIHRVSYENGSAHGRDVYPHNPILFNWSIDNYGPLYIPKKGDIIAMNDSSYWLYGKIIRDYENNPSLTLLGGKVYIEGKPITHYQFKMNYYWMMGDNRHNSADSRSWGFVPEDHIVGKPLFIFFSIKYKREFDPQRTNTMGTIEFKDEFYKIRFDRIFHQAYK
ncbi:MAG: signal peptidase I [Bacteroidetes bacterium]|nr:signal peptidase I [Bacteroidota bacterium]